MGGVEDAQTVVGNATGNVAKSTGTVEFGARLKRNDISTDDQTLFPAGLDGDDVRRRAGSTPRCT